MIFFEAVFRTFRIMNILWNALREHLSRGFHVGKNIGTYLRFLCKYAFYRTMQENPGTETLTSRNNRWKCKIAQNCADKEQGDEKGWTTSRKMKEQNKEYASEERNQGTSKSKHDWWKENNIRIKFNEEERKGGKIECCYDCL